MKKETFRDRRVGELLKEEISRIVQYEVKNPNIHGLIITDVVVTKDLSLARVYIRSFDGTDMEVLRQELDLAKNFIYSKLKKSIKIKKVPSLSFFVDNTLDYASKIEELLKQVKQQD
ncbi:30S ribosome-binding factor RbfA [Calditerrivibrio nitroreducens]|uniref:Ribosome-binding factor A n=1 Tax=Calditerrivibrio nitroreducens (strain DSM 19672 / NBRC 101217 / Yu37-1) TaxID=768670 RepID=E4TJD9_CALNY|nr:30S ribosome-binding factor RbfA [Calditerrivibrio nitroreducens]ADR19206.1 ribosome-binding factor A [Calditerrivibrio nitroreducens DSM 19672]